MSCLDAKVGDIVIANRLANEHHVYTKEGWIGIITRIDCWGNIMAKGKYPNEDKDEEVEFAINLNYFDFYQLTSAQELAKELGFKMEEIL